MAPTIITIQTQAELLASMQAAPNAEAIGACLAFLLSCADKNPGQLRAVLNAPVDKPGFRTRRIIDVLTQLAG